jgi:sugar/nucleoside kinase (ribokinase family)
LIGFDGFIDTILHAVDRRQSATNYTRIRTLKDFGERIAAAANKSTNVEVVVQEVKLGGNGPIMANAMAALGAPVTYCGMTGYPEIHAIFRELAERARMLSVAEPALTDAYEFEDGKLIVGKHATVAEISYDCLLSRLGEGAWRSAWNEAGFVAMVNWTMLPHLTELWKRLQAEFDKAPSGGTTKTLFFDLCDPEKRTTEDLREALQTIAAFQKHHQVILGLNEKEAVHAAEALGLTIPHYEGPVSEEVVADLARNIRVALDIAICLVHPTRFAGAATQDEVAVVHGPWTSNPIISTGAGDHFNAGFCYGHLLGLGLEGALQTGVATSGYYVRNAVSPSSQQLAEFLTTL